MEALPEAAGQPPLRWAWRERERECPVVVHRGFRLDGLTARPPTSNSYYHMTERRKGVFIQRRACGIHSHRVMGGFERELDKFMEEKAISGY